MFENTIDLTKIFNLQNAIIYLILINIIAFVAMGIDKHKAKYGKWRIKESVLFTLVLLGGGIGGIGQNQTAHGLSTQSYSLLNAAVVKTCHRHGNDNFKQDDDDDNDTQAVEKPAPGNTAFFQCFFMRQCCQFTAFWVS